MARKTLVVLEDDVDGGEASETVSFSLDGTSYEIDLNDDNAAALRDAFAPWVGAAHKGSRGARGSRAATSAPSATGGRRRTTPRASAGGGGSDVREWARANGYTISDRGRISADIQQAYDSAH